MSYEHHVFISYRRGEVWTPWVRDKFVRMLRGYLQLEIGVEEVFVDDQVEGGARWWDVLQHKVACYKIMLSLISAGYFHSEWCRKEMALMLQREERHGVVGIANNYGLVIPVRLGDGQCFPEQVSQIQCVDFESYADPDLPPGTERASAFNAEIHKLAKAIATVLPRVPDWRDEWRHFDGGAMLQRLEPRPPAPPAPPRLLI